MIYYATFERVSKLYNLIFFYLYKFICEMLQLFLGLLLQMHILLLNFTGIAFLIRISTVLKIIISENKVPFPNIIRIKELHCRCWTSKFRHVWQRTSTLHNIMHCFMHFRKPIIYVQNLHDHLNFFVAHHDTIWKAFSKIELFQWKKINEIVLHLP